MAGKKTRSGTKLGTKEIEAMFQDFLLGLTLTKIAEKFKRSLPTVIKYARVGDWETRRAEVNKEAEKRSNEVYIQKKVYWAGKIENMLEIVAERILKKKYKTRGDIDDLDRLVRLQSLLSGDVDSRSGFDFGNLFKDITTDELKQFLKRSEG